MGRFLEDRKKQINLAAEKYLFNWSVRERLYRHLAAQISNDIPVEISLDNFEQRLARNRKSTSANIVKAISKKMRNGSTFTAAIANWIPQDELAIISGGDLSGDIPKSLLLIIDSNRRLMRVNRALKAAIMSPFIYAVMVYAVIWAIGFFAMPILQLTMPKDQTSGVVYFLYTAGEIATSWYMLIVPAVAAILIFTVTSSFPRWTGTYRILAEKFFPYSFYRDINGFKWLMGFSALLLSGIPDTDILKRQSKNSSPWMKERLDAIASRMINGKSLPVALSQGGKNRKPPFGFPNPDIIDDISSFSGFIDFAERISSVAVLWSEDMEIKMLEQAKFYGLLLEIFMYGVMGFLMFAMNSMSEQMGSVPGF